MADRNDFGGISIPLHPQTGLACVFIYDGLPGGAGLTRQAFGHARELLEVCAAVIEACLRGGCPSCVHSSGCGSGNWPISKRRNSAPDPRFAGARSGCRGRGPS